MTSKEDVYPEGQRTLIAEGRDGHAEGRDGHAEGRDGHGFVKKNSNIKYSIHTIYYQ